MWRRALFVMCLGAAGAVDACGNETFTGGDDSVGEAGADGATAGDASPGDAAADVSTSNDGGINTTPTPLVTGEDNPNELVVAGGRLYWTTFSENAGTGGVRSVKVDGTDLKTIAKGVHANRLAVDATSVFWTDQQIPEMSQSFVGQAFLDGSDASVFVGGSNMPTGIAVDDQFVYVVNQTFGAITVYGKGDHFIDGTLASSLEVPVSIAVDNAGAAFTAAGTIPNSGVAAALELDGSLIGIGTGLATPWGVTLAGSTAYFTEIGSLDGSIGAGGIGVIDRTTSIGPSTLVNEGRHPYFITTDSANVYWTEEGDAPSYLNGRICYLARSGGSSVNYRTVALRRPHGIAADDQYIYWTEYDSGRIMRATKP